MHYMTTFDCIWLHLIAVDCILRWHQHCTLHHAFHFIFRFTFHCTLPCVSHSTYIANCTLADTSPCKLIMLCTLHYKLHSDTIPTDMWIVWVCIWTKTENWRGGVGRVGMGGKWPSIFCCSNDHFYTLYLRATECKNLHFHKLCTFPLLTVDMHFNTHTLCTSTLLTVDLHFYMYFIYTLRADTDLNTYTCFFVDRIYTYCILCIYIYMYDARINTCYLYANPLNVYLIQWFNLLRSVISFCTLTTCISV